MEKKSELFKNTTIKSNNKTFAYGVEKKEQEFQQIKKPDIKININKKINDIFKSTNYVYKINAKITLADREVKKHIIARTKDYLITLENEKIFIKDIIDIVEIE